MTSHTNSTTSASLPASPPLSAKQRLRRIKRRKAASKVRKLQNGLYNLLKVFIILTPAFVVLIAWLLFKETDYKEVFAFHFVLFSNVALTALTTTMLVYCFTKPKDGGEVKGYITVLVSLVFFLAFIAIYLYKNESSNILTTHTFGCFLGSWLLSYFIFRALKFIRNWAMSKPPYFRIARYKLPRDNRVLLIVSVWFLTFLITSYFAAFRYVGFEQISDEFYSSWSVDVIFFTFMGFAVAAATLKLPHDEEFSERVGMLFAAPSSNEALDYIENEVKKLGYTISENSRELVVKEYNSKIPGYKVELTIVTTLRNLFGDVDASDNINLGYNPVDFSNCGNNCPKPIGMLNSIFVEGGLPQDEGERLSAPVELLNGVKAVSGTFTAKAESPTRITMKAWSWVKVDEIMTHTPMRFIECSTTKLTNMIEKGRKTVFFSSPVYNDDTVTKLEYGKSATFEPYRNLSPKERIEFLVWKDKP